MLHTHDFPEGFIWGTATAAHQVEGNNKNSDWWYWEQKQTPKFKEPSDIACDSYNRYEEDFELCRQLNNNSVRISVEWARLEPEEGKFDQNEFSHYKKVLKSAQEKGLKTFVTLQHFTLPKWLADKGGWTYLKAPELFARYAERCEQEFSVLVDKYMTINEPQVYISMSYFVGAWPPFKKNPWVGLLLHFRLHKAHSMAYKAIKKHRNVEVGLVKNIVWYATHPHQKNIFDALLAKTLNYLGRDFYIRPIRNTADFFGLNYYFTFYIRHFKIYTPKQYKSDIGWWINPKGIENILLYLKKYNLPIYVTENGIADKDDKLRAQFIRGHLVACSDAIKKGANLKGYFHWSLLDNFEWHQGFAPRFGLVEIDRENNLARKPRMSFYYYANVCKNNAVEH